VDQCVRHAWLLGTLGRRPLTQRRALHRPTPPATAAYQGPANWWIDVTTGELKQMTVSGAAATNPTYRDTTDVSGPLWWRDRSAYAKGRMLTTTNVLSGSMGGAYFIWETAGAVLDFEELSVDIAIYDGGVGSAAGVVSASPSRASPSPRFPFTA
jgi:hypothetical protein